jgi:hypothetical protein
MEKLTTRPKILTKGLNSVRPWRPKIRRGSSICFSWTWKLYRKKDIEVRNRLSRKFFAEGFLTRIIFDGRDANRVRSVAKRICNT